MAACIEISNLTKRYGKTVAVDDLSLEAEAGEILGLLGPNGAGKSTTLHMLTGLVRPTSGRIAIFGKELHRHFIGIAARMGVVLERPALYEYLTVRQNLMFLARLADREVTVDRALNLTGLLHVGGQKVGTLSMGMRQRLGLAQALLGEPEALILDEPANGLDPEAATETLRLLRRLAVESKVTIVISSHMLNEVEGLCDRVAVLNHGRLVACDRIDALLSYDASRVEVLLDAPESAARKLRGQPWVQSVEVQPGKLVVALGDADAHHLMTFLTGAGCRLTGVVPRRMTLQDYFVKVLHS